MLITMMLFGCGTFCMGQKQDLSRLITAIAIVESKQNEKAVSRDCVGYLQIRPILVQECNDILKAKGMSQRYKLGDRYDKKKSIEMFYVIQDKYNPCHNIEKALWIWNAGPTSKKRPTEYMRRVMKEYNKIR